MTAYEQHKAKLKQQGYGEALADVAQAFRDGGFEKVAEWLKDNATQHNTDATQREVIADAVAEMGRALEVAAAYRDAAIASEL